ncbi:MAG: hypothetical protein E4G99_02025 [Anaerolineales bacterium]|nr:MAG: hypothetical protein E4G99_02025 [Anaerolineales bacterium]
MTAPVQLRVAAVLFWITAFGFGVFCLPAIRNLLLGGDIPYIMGFPAYGKGPFESVGIATTVPLLAAFLLVCILEGVAGWLLWGGHKAGATFGLVLVPAGAIFWWGFALPFPPIFALVRTILIVLSWQSLR